jgi:hypothetical protein
MCGIPLVTLENENADWEKKLLARSNGLPSFCRN